MNLAEKIIACFVNNLAMGEGLNLIAQFEAKGEGVNFSNWSQGYNVDDKFSLLQVMIVMVFNNVIHILLTLYFENIAPGIHGIAKPWHYPISGFFSKKKSTKNEEIKNLINEASINKGYGSIRGLNSQESINGEQQKIISNNEIHSQIFIEDESIYSTRNIGIKINNIVKIFKQLGTIKKAVQNLTLNIYEGQISVLLGHNGAGKSTTISMITGLCEPTSGNILINNNDIVENTNEARSVLGYCPQHNLLFDDLTVYEHLKLFSKLKQNYNENEINNMLDLINLTDKKHALSKTLSGGMKRKLSVAIAFIGGSKIVILDEPSNYSFIFDN
jgi:ABC-type lipoprotein export system ATPase subunit